MNAAEMKAKCEKIARQENAIPRSIPEGAPCPGRRIADAIAALSVEADPRDAQIAALKTELDAATCTFEDEEAAHQETLNMVSARDAQVAAMREALKPFKKLADEIDLCRNGGRPEDWAMACKWHDLVRARLAYAASEPKG